jgi:hypothetical protein
MGKVYAEKHWVALSNFKKACLQRLTVHWKFKVVLIFINPETGFIHSDCSCNSYASPLCKDHQTNVNCLLWVMIQPTMPVTVTESNCQVLFHTDVCQLRVTVTCAFTVCKFAVFLWQLFSVAGLLLCFFTVWFWIFWHLGRTCCLHLI